MNAARRFWGIVAIGLGLIIVSTAAAKYSGGTGEPNDPYQIATAADLIALGDTPADYDKHFLLTADIDLDPNLPGRKVFDKAVIAPDIDSITSGFQGTDFTGVFDGTGRTISHLTIAGKDYVGLLGRLGSDARVSNLGIEAVEVSGAGRVGGLAGSNARWGEPGGKIVACYSGGSVSGSSLVGGLVGENDGSITTSYSAGVVTGDQYVGGLVGENWEGSIAASYSIGSVSGKDDVGGLVGSGLPHRVSACVWDIETSGLSGSAGGAGLTTAEMMDPYMLGLNGFANDPNWVVDAGRKYPRLAWEGRPGQIIPEPEIDWLEGEGTPDSAYRIGTADQLILLGRASILWNKHFTLAADIDLDPALPGRSIFGQAVMPVFAGVFDGGGHVISNLTIEGGSDLGLFGYLTSAAQVMNIGVVDVNITGSGSYVGGLVGANGHWSSGDGSITNCYSTGSVNGKYDVGGLVGHNAGDVTQCYSTGLVTGSGHARGSGVGGLVGTNSRTIAQCYSRASVIGDSRVGGLVGSNIGDLIDCCSTGWVSGNSHVGGLVGGDRVDGGKSGMASSCFWDTQTSGQATSAGGTGRTTAEMQTASTFLEAGWDLLGETANGTEDIWKIAEGIGYPRLAWEKYSGGTGEPNDPYQIATAADLIALGETPEDYDKHFILTADLDLDPNLPGRRVFDRAVIAPGVKNANWEFEGTPFVGVFEGSSHTISHLTIAGKDYLGLFGQLGSTARVSNLGLEAVEINGTGNDVGSLVGVNGSWPSGGGSIANCHSTGSVDGNSSVGGLVGWNFGGSVTASYSSAAVSGTGGIGGLVGSNEGRIANCYSSGSVSGDSFVGGLVGSNDSCDYYPEVIQCYSSGSVIATGWSVGGLVGGGGMACIYGIVTSSFWDTQTSGPSESWRGIGLTTSKMQDPNTFKAAGWDFVGSSDGPHDIWAMPEGGGYPILWWQLSPLAELPTFSGGTGEPNDPYFISTAEELNGIGHNPRLMKCHFKLVHDLDLSGCCFHPIGGVDHPYVGVFDGGGHTVSHLTLTGEGFLGLFGHLAWGATVKDLGVPDVSIAGTGDNIIGGLVGTNGSSYRYPFTEGGLVLNCYSSGSVIATGEGSFVGGLVGYNSGSVLSSYSSASGSATGLYSPVGGLVGGNTDSITNCCSTGAVSGTRFVGGLAGENYGTITTSYSSAWVSDSGWEVGGPVGYAYYNTVTSSFWDIETSGETRSAGGTGKTTAEMQTASTFLDAGWDFVGETTNGTEDIWWIDEGKDYPRLWWETADEQ